ncbi:hypothetical protein SBOR_2488 [Sclerotinia borealis F-4128]|uniref:C4-dicarboxylate transporter/malic acid transport protein n=1 Tax=Sclerotinia borealis (strain F-4128) TaxID=1432307 RepID=W9CRL0_SCLBF|nr:hypothetical protein SBOR_2488 [Sclerotinia borealis F-4128]
MSTTSPLPRLMNDTASTNPLESQVPYFKDDSSANESTHRNGWQRSGLEVGHGETNRSGNRNIDRNTNGVPAGPDTPIVDRDHGVDGVDQQPDTQETAVGKVSVRDRIGCMTWTWFTLSMATGGIANVLYSNDIYGIPKTGLWFQTTMQVCFWAYSTLSVIASSGLYLLLWSTQEFPISNMTPLWTFPAYPLLLIGPIASNLISTLPDASAAARINSTAIAFGAICFQATGFLLSLMIYSAFMYRLMTKKLPQETTRPGMFVSVGPSGFTVTAVVGLASSVRTIILPDGYMGNVDGPFILYLMGNLTGLFIWGLCLWFCLISIGAHWQVARPNHPEHHISPDMTWNSFVFPNTALATATLQIGTAFGSNAIRIIGTVISVLLVIVWLYVLGMLIRALFLKRLLMPGQLDGATAQRKKWANKVGNAIGKI